MSPVSSEPFYKNTNSTRALHQNNGDEDDSPPERPTVCHCESVSVKGVTSCTPRESQWVRRWGDLTVKNQSEASPAKERALLRTKGLLFNFILLDINQLRYCSVLQRKIVSC